MERCMSRQRLIRPVALAVALVILRGTGTPVLGQPKMTARQDLDDKIGAYVDRELVNLLSLYKHFHNHPELSLQEQETSARIALELRQAGFQVTEAVGGYGVVGVLSNGPGSTVLIRTDTDALPITEQTGLRHASRVVATRPDGVSTGVMHACGHDVHMTVFTGVARLLTELRGEWRGTLVMIAQPAEEIGMGAAMMIDAGLFERFPKPDYCIALHVDADIAAGQVGYTPGYCNANVDSVDITIYGMGGHGARPHQAIDPIVAAAQVVMGLQTIVSRRVDPLERAVVTVGSIHGGTKHNIIPGQVHLQLTVRSYKDEVRTQLLDSIRQIATDICKAAGCPKPPDVVVNASDHYTPAAYNDPELVQGGVGLLQDLLGTENVVQRPPSMGGEDFGRYARALGVPGFMFRLGSVNAEEFQAAKRDGLTLPVVHSPAYAPDPLPTIGTGVRSMSALALSLLDACGTGL